MFVRPLWEGVTLLLPRTVFKGKDGKGPILDHYKFLGLLQSTEKYTGGVTGDYYR